MSKAANAALQEAKREHDWKATLAAIREGLPTEASIPKLKGETKRDHSVRERQVLYALCVRQEWRCFWCGQVMTDGPDFEAPNYRTLEHVIARAIKPEIANHLNNLRAACKQYNNERAQMANLQKVLMINKNLGDRIQQLQEILARHRVTMSGRCYFCKFRFHFKEWLYRFRKDRRET